MKGLSTREGFSLVELLTVIAIIAILAAIIFPVMTSVKDRAKMTQCMTNLMNIQNAIKLYKMDNRTFPETLGPLFQPGIPFDEARPGPDEATVYKDEIKSAAAYRCPSSPVIDYKAGVEVTYPTVSGGNPVVRMLYSVDSYDTQTDQGSSPVLARYCLRWARTEDEVAHPPGVPYELKPHPPSLYPSDNATLREQDFERQLAFKNPPEDTVVTWCTYHKGDAGLVLFLDGHVDRIPKTEIGQSLWRVRPKKL